MFQRAFDLFTAGGPVMWPLLVCAVLSVAVMLERFIVLRRAAASNEALIEQVRAHLSRGRVAEALQLCERTPGPVPALLASGIRSRSLDAVSIERAIEERALRETPLLYRRLVVLDTIITIAPLLGLLGTVIGMMRTFRIVQSAGGNNPGAITGGIAEALIATACGLAIAIVTLVGYNCLNEKVKEILSEMEIRATELINLLAELRAGSVGEERGVGEAAAARA